MPISPEAVIAERLVTKAGADRFFRHYNNGLFQPLVVQLIQRSKHKRAAFARCRRRLDQQVLLASPFVGTLLHGPHAKLIGRGRTAIAGV